MKKGIPLPRALPPNRPSGPLPPRSPSPVPPVASLQEARRRPTTSPAMPWEDKASTEAPLPQIFLPTRLTPPRRPPSQIHLLSLPRRPLGSPERLRRRRWPPPRRPSPPCLSNLSVCTNIVDCVLPVHKIELGPPRPSGSGSSPHLRPPTSSVRCDRPATTNPSPAFHVPHREPLLLLLLFPVGFGPLAHLPLVAVAYGR